MLFAIHLSSHKFNKHCMFHYRDQLERWMHRKFCVGNLQYSDKFNKHCISKDLQTFLEAMKDSGQAD